jgi:hypothetical protein
MASWRRLVTEAGYEGLPMNRIRMVDGHDDEIAGTFVDLHRLTFFDGASIPKFEQGHWWLAFYKANGVAFAGIVASKYVHNAGYLPRRRAQTALRP